MNELLSNEFNCTITESVMAKPVTSIQTNVNVGLTVCSWSWWHFITRSFHVIEQFTYRNSKLFSTFIHISATNIHPLVSCHHFTSLSSLQCFPLIYSFTVSHWLHLIGCLPTIWYQFIGFSSMDSLIGIHCFTNQTDWICNPERGSLEHFKEKCCK